jgi:hypothetical protein
LGRKERATKKALGQKLWQVLTTLSNQFFFSLSEAMKQVMSKRYDAVTGALNMCRFHNDSAFLGHDVYVPLSRCQFDESPFPP